MNDDLPSRSRVLTARLAATWLVVALLALTGCASGGSPGAAPTPTGTESTSPDTSPGPARGAADWPTYHADATRTGSLSGSEGQFRSAAVAWQSPGLDGDIYASPIVAGGIVVVATENDTVYAFDASSGKQRWMRHLADPVVSSTLPCGGIKPVSGITSTPVASPAQDLLYAVAFVRPAQHVLFTLKLSSGEVQSRRPVDPPGESPMTHQQRGALALANGYVYVPYGGLLGDCGQYHGWLIGIPVEGGDPISYRVPCDRECGLWAPGGPTIDQGGDLWVASGNGEPFTKFTYSNAVLRLTPDLKLRDFFAPANWADLSRKDLDLGSISPILVEGGLVWISGKSSTGYLLRRDHLGGIGGQAFSGPACDTFSSAIASGSTVYAACPDQDQLLAVQVDPTRPSFSRRWQAERNAPGAPILAFGALWVIDTGDGTLAALDPQNGRQLSSFPGGSAQHFVTPAAAAGHVYAALGRHLLAVRARTAG
jgi:outer membrane protein assembly factor BamB